MRLGRTAPPSLTILRQHASPFDSPAIRYAPLAMLKVTVKKAVVDISLI